MRKCKYCGYSDIYIECYKCVEWKTKLQVKPGLDKA